MATHKIFREKTPHGGDYLKLVYLDDEFHAVDESVATCCEFLEYKDSGELVSSTMGQLEKNRSNVEKWMKREW